MLRVTSGYYRINVKHPRYQCPLSNVLIHEQFPYIDKFMRILTLKDSEWGAKEGLPNVSIKRQFY